MNCLVAVLWFFVLEFARGDLLGLFSVKSSNFDSQESAGTEAGSIDLPDYDTFEDTAKLVPADGFDYRNSNTNVSCGPACSYSILGMVGVGSFLANRYLNPGPVASSRKGPDFEELQAELKEAKEKVADVSEKMEYALKMADKRKEKKKMAYAMKITEEKNNRKKKLENYSGRKRGASKKGILDYVGKGLQYAVKYAQELELAKLKKKKGYGSRKMGYPEPVKEKYKRPDHGGDMDLIAEATHMTIHTGRIDMTVDTEQSIMMTLKVLKTI